MSKQHSKFVELLDQTGLLDITFPGISILKTVDQSPKYHPEGNVWNHTLLVLENLPDKSDYPLFLAALYHDVGKLDTYLKDETGKISFHGHEEISCTRFQIICDFLFKLPNEDIEHILFIIENHMKVHMGDVSKKTIRRIIQKAKDPHWIVNLLTHGYADVQGGSKNFEDIDRSIVYFKEISKEAPVIKIKPILNGGELMLILGLKPGPMVGQATNDLLEYQIENDNQLTKEQATEWISSNRTKYL